MSSRVVLVSKYVGETQAYQIDFLSQLQTGVTLSGANATTCSVYSGVDGSPSSVVSGSATTSGTVLTQKLTGGVAGVLYLITFSGSSSAGETLLIEGILAVTPAP